MQEDVREIVQIVKDQLPKRGAYPRISKLSRGRVSIEQIKKVFTFRVKDVDTINLTLEAAEKYLRENDKQLSELRRRFAKPKKKLRK